MAFATHTRWGFAAALCGFTSFAAADNPLIQDIAPTDTFLFVSVPNWTAAKTAFMRSPVGGLWQDKSMQDWVEKIWKDMHDSADAEEIELLGDLREHLEAIGEPAGAIGGAWSLALDPQARAAAEGEGPGMISHMLLMADFGPGAEKAEAAIIEFLEEQEKKDRLSMLPVNVAGIDAHKIELKVDADAPIADPDDDVNDPDGFDDFGGMDDLGGLDFASFLGGNDGLITLFLARSGTAIVLASRQNGLEHALDRLAGANRPHLADNADFAAALAQHPRGGHLFAGVFLTDSVREMIRGAGSGLSGLLPLPIDGDALGMEKIFATLGLAPVKAITLGARLDAQVQGVEAMEQTFGVLLAEKKGLFGLIEGEGAPLDPPMWIGADVAGVGRFNVRFERIIPLLEEIVKILPPELADFAAGGVQFAKASFGPALAVMGPEMYVVDSITRPLSATSQATTTAIKIRDELAVANAVSGIAAQAGLDSRDFQGAQIYDDAGATFAIGLGFGWLFIGEPSGVENAMRRAANPGVAGQPLAASERFRRAVSAANAAGPGLMQSWTDDIQRIEHGIWAANNSDAIMRQEWVSMGLDPAEVDEIMEGVETDAPEWLKDMPSADLFKKYFDSSAVSFRSTPDGFRGTYISLPARKP